MTPEEEKKADEFIAAVEGFNAKQPMLNKRTVYTARKSCRHCYGRGVVGIDLKSGRRMRCTCVKETVIDVPTIKAIG